MELRLDQIAALVGGDLLAGDPAKTLNGVATLEEAGSSDLSFFGVAKYKEHFEKTQAGGVLVTPDVTGGPDGVGLIQVENPSYALAVLARAAAEAMRAFQPGVHPGAHVLEGAQVDPKASVRPGAVVEAGAVVGPGSEIGSGAFVGRGARIGADCLLYPNSTVREGCVLGDRVTLQPGAVIGSDGFGYEFVDGRHEKVPQIGIVVLGDDVEVGANACIDRARFGKTVIGAGSKIDNMVQVAHNVQTGEHCILVAQCGIAGSSRLGNYVTVAAQSGINGHISLADKVTIAGQSGVPKTITEPGGVYWGLPAKPFKDEMRLWKALGSLHETTREVRALRKEVDGLKEE